MNKPTTTTLHNTVPSGITRVVTLLMKKAMEERLKIVAARPTSQDALWLNPDGSFQRRARLKRKSRRSKPIPLLVHDPRHDAFGISKLSFVARLVIWICEGHYEAIFEELTLEELADAYQGDFFKKIDAHNAQKRARLAIAAKLKQRLCTRALGSAEKSGDRSTPPTSTGP